MAKAKNSLVDNINRRKKAGISRSKADSHVSSAAWGQLKAGWPKSARATSGGRAEPAPATAKKGKVRQATRKKKRTAAT